MEVEKTKNPANTLGLRLNSAKYDFKFYTILIGVRQKGMSSSK